MERNLSNLVDEDYDLLIVGGGVYGAAAAREAALRGLSVALIERDDFGSGTSWNSFKTIHGGFRYLQKLNLPRVLDSIRERRQLLRLAPHLIRPLEFILPTRGFGLRSQPALAAALAMYGIAGVGRNRGVRPDRCVSNGRLLGPKRLRAMLPEFDLSNASGAAAWCDAQMISSERVVLGMLQAAAEEGAQVANHVEALDWVALGPGRVRGVRAIDKISGSELEIHSRMVLNCAGPWAWSLGTTDTRTAAPGQSRAVNVVLRRSFSREFALGLSISGACPARGEQILFMAPWRERTLLGTIHLPSLPGAADAPGALRLDVTEAEIAQLLGAVNRCHPDLKLDLSDVAVVHAGVQAIAGWDPRTGHALHVDDAFAIDHARRGGPRGIVSLVGIKFTEACGAAAKGIDLVCGQLGVSARRPIEGGPPLPGGAIESLADLRAELAVTSAQLDFAKELDADILEHLGCMYGTRAPDVIALATTAELAERVTRDSPVIGAEVVFAVREEMALSLADVVMRRTELGARGDADTDAIERCSEIAARELAWSPMQRRAEHSALEKTLMETRVQ